ncbi:MAG: hypothetical protein Kow0031_08050 [Anaerolineae bacterium]
MPTATSFSNTIDWASLAGAFKVIVTLLNSPVALTLAVILTLSLASVVAVGVMGRPTGQQAKGRKGKSGSRKGGKKYIRVQQKPQLTLWQQIACFLFPGFCKHLYRQRLKRPKQRVVAVGGGNDDLPQKPKRNKGRSKKPATQNGEAKEPRRKKRPADAPQPAPQKPRPPKITPTFGLPLPALDLDAALAEADAADAAAAAAQAERDTMVDNVDAPAPGLSFGLPLPALDLDAALAEADAAEAAAAQAEREAAEAAAELQRDINLVPGLPQPDIERMIFDQTWAAMMEQRYGPDGPPPEYYRKPGTKKATKRSSKATGEKAGGKTASSGAASAGKAGTKSKGGKTRKTSSGKWKTDLDSLVSAGLQQVDRGSTPYEVADMITKFNFIGAPRGKNKARGEYLARLQTALAGRESKLKEMADSLTGEGWRFIKSDAGGFWYHEASDTSINRNGGSFDTYAEATEHAFNSPVRELNQVQQTVEPATPPAAPPVSEAPPVTQAQPAPQPKPARPLWSWREITTPGTRITWNSVDTWLAGYNKLKARRDSSNKYSQIRAHIAAIPREMIEAETSTAALYELEQALSSERPPKGMRGDDPTTPLIQFTKNRMANLQRKHYERQREQIEQWYREHPEADAATAPATEPLYQYDAPIGPEPAKGVIMYDVPPTPIRPRPEPITRAQKILPDYTQRLLDKALALPISTYSGMIGSNDYAVIDRVKSAFANWIEGGAAGNASLDEAWFEFVEWGHRDDPALDGIELSHTPNEQPGNQASLFDAAGEPEPAAPAPEAPAMAAHEPTIEPIARKEKSDEQPIDQPTSQPAATPAPRPDPGVLPERTEPGQPADQPGADHPRPLAETPPPDVPRTGADRPTGTGDTNRLDADQRGDLPDGGGVGDNPVRSLGGSAPSVGDIALGGGAAGTVDEPDRVGDAARGGGTGRGLDGDYRITDADRIGVGGAKQKYRDNVAAIRLLKQLEAEGRQATPEEQAILVKYVGWGGLPKVFDPYETYSWNRNAQWREEYTELRDLLTDDEYNAARGSTANAHYTAPGVISAMWDGLRRMGFQGGRVLEPAAGVGHFFGLMPDDLAANSQRIATELDPVSGRITQQLYPNAEVRVGGFEEGNLPNNFIDLAISNVPFGNYGVHDPDFRRERKFLTKSIHNYFFAKALDKVKPGGVVAFVTSRFTLDSKDSRVREYLAQHADLVGAIRLPNTAFKENAMTDVTTDIIFLRKRREGEKPADTAWVDTVEQTDDNDRSYRLNEYFVNNPAMMLGKMEVSGNMYRDSADLIPDDRDLNNALAQAIETLPADILQAPPAVVPDDTISQPPPFYERRRSAGVERIREGSYFVGDDNQVYRRQNGFDVVVETGAKSAKTAAQNVERVRGLTAIREATRDLLDLNLAGATDEELDAGQARLNAAYDAFTEQFGPIHLVANQKAIDGDPDKPVLLALERYDRDTKRATKAAIFRDRVIGMVERPARADSAKDAMLISMNEFGGLNWERMEALTGRSQDDLIAELGDVIFLNPEGGWETAETYLSGNIRQKLRAAEAAAALEPLYERNVAALRDALPRELAPHEIWANLGAGWIPDEVVQQFVREELGLGWRVKVSYIEDLAQWVVDADKYAKDSWENNNSEWASNRATVLELVDAALNARTVTIRDSRKDADGKRVSVVNESETMAARAKQTAIRERFAQWVWEDADRAADLAAIYNEQFNATAPQKYDGSHLNLPGTAADIAMRPHQKDAIWRIVQGGENTLLAHQVGAGKTFTMIAAGMELRRLGLRKKVMHVVLNSTLDQYAADFQRLYPGARILVLDAKAVSPARRKETMSRIATEDWDAIITTHTSFEKLPVQDETFNRFLREQIDVLEQYMAELRDEDAKGNRKTIKEMEKAKKRLEAKLRDKRDAKEKDDALTWEQLGVDHLFVDEAHKFKNLYFPTKRGRVAGIGGSESGRAFDLFIKTRELARHGGLTMATGTPIANSVSEMYTMQRYLQYDRLKEMGLGHFDAWANMFGDTVTAIEMKPTGSGYRMYSRFAKFNNVPELLRMYHQAADVQMDLDALGIQRPDLASEAVSVEPSESLKAFIQEAEARAENLGRVDPREDNMLKIVSDANKAALDMRLIDVTLPDEPGSKVNAVVDRVLDVYQRTSGATLPGLAEPQNLTQLVFLDTSIPGAGDEFSVYQDIKQKLVKAGVAENEVAFIHDAKTDAQRLALFEKVNKGEVRVLLGSTEKMGTGVNVQRLLYAVHHVDAPWRPADIEQREGRILRQGNLNPNVEIYRYATEGSFDVFKWQTLETKAKFISQINSGDMDSRSIEDIDAAVIGYAEMKALASGNPIMMEKIKVEADLRRVEGLFKSWQSRRYELQRELRDLPGQLERARAVADSYRRLLADREKGGTALNEELGEKLVALGEQAAAGPVSAGKLFNRPAQVKIGKDGPQLLVQVDRGVEMGFRITQQPKRNANKLQALFGDELQQRLDRQEQAIADIERAISGNQAELDKPFEQMAELEALRQRYAAIEEEIDTIEAGQPAQVFDEATFGPDTGNDDTDNDE